MKVKFLSPGIARGAHFQRWQFDPVFREEYCRSTDTSLEYAFEEQRKREEVQNCLKNRTKRA
jgi:hypothetical protein